MLLLLLLLPNNNTNTMGQWQAENRRCKRCISSGRRVDRPTGVLSAVIAVTEDRAKASLSSLPDARCQANARKGVSAMLEEIGLAGEGGAWVGGGSQGGARALRELPCSACGLSLPAHAFSASQLKQSSYRRCTTCVAADAWSFSFRGAGRGLEPPVAG